MIVQRTHLLLSAVWMCRGGWGGNVSLCSVQAIILMYIYWALNFSFTTEKLIALTSFFLHRSCSGSHDVS